MKYLGIDIKVLDDYISTETDLKLIGLLKQYRKWILDIEKKDSEFADWRFRVDIKIIKSNRTPEFKSMLLELILV